MFYDTTFMILCVEKMFSWLFYEKGFHDTHKYQQVTEPKFKFDNLRNLSFFLGEIINLWSAMLYIPKDFITKGLRNTVFNNRL